MKNLPGGKGMVAGIGAAMLAIAAAFYLGSGETPGSTIEPADQTARAPAPTANTADEVTAADTGQRAPATTLAAAAIDAVSAVEAAPGGTARASAAESDPTAVPSPPASFTTDDQTSQRSVADTLLAATRDASPEISLGPFTACFDQMRAIACPIVGSIPVIKDVVGRLSLELGISCPTSSAATRT